MHPNLIHLSQIASIKFHTDRTVCDLIGSEIKCGRREMSKFSAAVSQMQK